MTLCLYMIAAECVDGGISVASLHLVDLAGSERYEITTPHIVFCS